MFSQVIYLPSSIIDVALWLVTATTLMSGYAYISEWGGRAWHILKDKRLAKDD